MALFKGAGVALITPMKENHEINFDKLDELLEEQIAGRTDDRRVCYHDRGRAYGYDPLCNRPR